MGIEEIEPEALAAAWADAPPAVYLDVRTVAEFATGRPKGPAINVPWVFYYPGTREEHPNDSFLAVLEALYPKDTPFVVGCKAGGRARRAAEALAAAGYSRLRLLKGGYDAWQARGLMSTTDNRPGISYVSLLTRVKRPAAKAGHGH